MTSTRSAMSVAAPKPGSPAGAEISRASAVASSAGASTINQASAAILAMGRHWRRMRLGMLRLVERLIGEGHLHDPKAPGAPLPTAYELDVYRDWQVEAGVMVAGEWVIEGHLLAPPDALAALAGRAGTFTLHMDDGRRLEVFVLDGEGRLVNVEGTTFIVPAP